MSPEALKAARTRLGLTQAQLADQIGYSLPAVKAMERGARAVSPRAVKLVESLLNAQSVKNPTR